LGSVKFSEEGYRYGNEKCGDLFQESKMHDLLFHYVTKDLSKLPMLLEQYVSKKMDIKTFELTDYQYKDDDFVEIEEILLSLHPYCEHEIKKVFIKAIENYFNALLIEENYGTKKETRPSVLDEDLYVEKFTVLTSPYLEFPYKEPKTSYDEYKKKRNAYVSDDVDSPFILLEDRLPLEGFFEEIRTQEQIKKLLFWLLDISAPHIGKLTIPQRIWLYEDNFQKIEIDITRKVSFTELTEPLPNCDQSEEVNDSKEMTCKFEFQCNLNDFHVNPNDISDEILAVLNHAIECATAVAKKEVYEEYVIDNLKQLLFLEIMSMIKTNTVIKKCKNCGLYYVVTNRKIEYCDRIVAGEEKTCYAIGSKRTFEKKLENDYPLKIYTRAYKKNHTRRQRGIMTYIGFEKWSREAKENLDKVRAEEMDIAEFEKWLKDN